MKTFFFVKMWIGGLCMTTFFKKTQTMTTSQHRHTLQESIMKHIRQHNWQGIELDQLTTWLDVAMLKIKSHIIHVQIKELLGYLTQDDILKGRVNMQYDQDYVQHLFLTTEFPEQKILLQEPEETFQEKIETDPCIRCKSKNTTQKSKQTRSCDEPESEFNQCLDCGKIWRTA